jgi:hypothetical protein
MYFVIGANVQRIEAGPDGAGRALCTIGNSSPPLMNSLRKQLVGSVAND